MTWPDPTPEEQVLFLRNVQRLLAEGSFVASYKYALLHALADLAVVKGEDTGAPLELTTREIAAKFIELYWRQCRPFQAGGAASGLVLQQNTGRQQLSRRSPGPRNSVAHRCSGSGRSPRIGGQNSSQKSIRSSARCLSGSCRPWGRSN